MNLLQSIAVVGAQGNVFADGMVTLILGIGVVFVALIALIIILEIMGKFFENRDKKAAAEKAAVISATPVEPEPVVVEPEPEDDLELIAVITAALAASMGTSAEGLQVKSIRKTNNTWKMSGRTEQLYN